MADKVVLYGYFRSSASWRVRIALALKDIKYEYKAVHLLKNGGEQHSEEYKKLNPMGQLPTLIIDGLTLTQSLAIMEYLEERNPTPALLPPDAAGRAQVRALSEVINSGIQPLQNLNVLQKIGDTKVEWANFYITKGFKALEAMLEKTAGQYCYGNQMTMADLCLIPQVYGAQRFGVDVKNYPVIMRVYEELIKLPAVIAGDAFRQPDTPEDLRAS
ncbi:maleylacetoacetate isomerase [Aplysia californica]|uniref:maleylacetoacetate isomerase n=1 Tax=Aplysia californica TaxID=6500 RepID=A0ABM0K233_APLCA|nr:maleylacetoacetate isomerase [Aplysia californica]